MYQCFCHFVCQSFLQLFFQRFAQYLHAALQPLARLVGVVDADVVAPTVLAGVKNVSGDQREDILKGRYKQQDELREATIGKELGVSRTPVREALRQLELEGLVTIVPNKGAYVTGISQKDIWDIYQMRKYLEGMCARWAAEHITEDQLEELEETILLSEFQMKKENGYNKEQVTGLDGRFHTILYEASGSRMLCHVLTDFHRYVQMARKSSINVKARAEKSIEEHKAILQAIRDRNPDLAEQLAKEHIVHVMQNLKKIEEKHNQEEAKDGKN